MKPFLYLICGLSSLLFAGGDILPKMIPIEPIEVKQLPVPVYVGVGFSSGRYFSSKYEDVTYGMMVRMGYELNQYIGFEARYIATFWEEGHFNGQELEHVGLFVKPTLSLGDNFNIYGLLGYAWTETHTESKQNPSIGENGFSAGLGLEYDISTKRNDYDQHIYYPEGFDGQADQEVGWGLFVDFQRLLIDSDMPDLDVVSAGVTYDF